MNHPSFWTGVFFFLLGGFIGSFLHVCIFRLPIGLSVVYPGSSCSHCKSPIRWYDNIPLLSSWILTFKCRSCKQSFSKEPWMIEFLSAIWALICFLKFKTHQELILSLIFGSTLLAIFFTDLKHRIIPNQLIAVSLLLGVTTHGLFFFFGKNPGFLTSLLGMIIGFSSFWLLSEVFYRIKGYEGLGGGDVKMAACIGLFLGIQGLLVSVLLASLLGLSVSLPGVFLYKTGKKFPIPFGPFLALGSYLFLLFQNEISLILPIV